MRSKHLRIFLGSLSLEKLGNLNLFSLQSVCVLVAVLLHYLYLASFGWMLLEGVFLYVMIVEVFSTVNVRYLYLFAWGKLSFCVLMSLCRSGDPGLCRYVVNDLTTRYYLTRNLVTIVVKRKKELRSYFDNSDSRDSVSGSTECENTNINRFPPIQ